MNYDPVQLAALWDQNGGDPGQAATAAAVATAESSGNPNDINWNDPEGSFGLWQINRYWQEGNFGAAFFSPPAGSGQGWNDPNLNAQAAIKIEKNSGWGAWSTFTSGRYLKYLLGGQSSTPMPTPVGAQPAPATGGDNSTSPIPTFPTNPVQLIGQIAGNKGAGNPFGAFLALWDNFWKQHPVALLFAGLAIVGLAYFLLVSRDDDNNGSGGTPVAVVTKASSEAPEAVAAA